MRRLFYMLLVLCGIAQEMSAQTVRYVKTNGSTAAANASSATSWSAACNDLQAVINASAAGDQVWVAAGIYKPNRPVNNLTSIEPTNRNSTFALKKDVKIYGGFAGTETVKEQRDTIAWAYKSVLSGDLGVVNDNGDNAYHVVVSYGDVGSAMLNGFTVTGGNASANDLVIFNTYRIHQGTGGGIYNYDSSPFLTNLIVTGNRASSGGGISNEFRSSPVLTNMVISSNLSTTNGGGIKNDESSAKLTNVTIVGNSSEYIAGGFHNTQSSTCFLTNVSIIGNASSYKGGGLYNFYHSSAILINVTVSGNRSPNGGGIYHESFSWSKLYNGIVWGNNSDFVVDNNNQSEVYNSIIRGSGGSGNWNIDRVLDGGNNLDVDPMFVAAPSYSTAPFIGGDYRLQATSPAINVGKNSYYAGLSVETKDLAGNPRVPRYFGGDIIDMGAYEYQIGISPNADGVLFVKKGSNGSGSSWADALGELADALKEAKTNTAIKQIWVAKGTYAPLYSPADDNFGKNADRDNTFLLVKDVKVYGGFAGTETAIAQRNLLNSSNKSVLSGDIGVLGNSSDNAYHVVVAAGDVGTAMLDGFTFTGGNANGNGDVTVNGQVVLRNSGAGMFNRSSSPTLVNGIFTTNIASAAGGAMYNRDNASPNIAHSSFVNNVATSSGGAMYNENVSSPSISNSSFSGNSSSNDGGAMYNYYYSSPKITNCSFTSNTATNEGGVILNNSSSPIIINTTITNNGNNGFHSFNSTPVLKNSILWDAITGGYEASYSILKGANPAGVGNINATNLTEADIFFGYANSDFRLKDNSPAVNAGGNSLYDGLGAATTDLDGNARVYNYAVGGIIDIGAYEYQGDQIVPDANGIVYVKKGSAGKGSSWANAVGELADVLKVAKTIKSIKQIWVAAGIYHPLYSSADNNFGSDAGRDNAFLLVKDVKIYGGFEGVETAITQRDMINWPHKSILSGDIGAVGDHTDNVRHVVLSSGDVGTAELNGFTVTDGRADGISTTTVNSNTIFPWNGAGIHAVYSSPTLRNLTISSNRAAKDGGGIANDESSSPLLTNVTISGNTAYFGGGISNHSASSPILSNTVVSGNSGGDGGGIYNSASSSIFTNVTISGNLASSSGGGIFNEASSLPEIYNSIIWGNNSGVFNNDSNSKPKFYNSIIQGSGGSSNWNLTVGTNGGNNLDADPKFLAAPAPTAAPFISGDYNLHVTSPAINRGGNSYYTGLSNTTDLAGYLRAYNYANGGVVDMGAYEYTPVVPNADGVLFVKKGGTGKGTTWATALGEVADALKEKTNTAIKQVWVAAGTYYPMYSPADDNFGNDAGRLNTFLLVKDVKIYGGFEGVETATAQRDTTNWSHKSILSGDIGVLNDDTDNVHHVVVSSGNVGTAQLNGFTVTGGAAGNASGTINVNSNSVDVVNGGGIYNISSSPTLANLIISGNLVRGVGKGGGVYNKASSPKLTHVTISGNTAIEGGYGGGIYNISSSAPVLTNVTITGNAARVNGGGMLNESSSPQLTNVTISNNSSSANFGGGIYNVSSSPILNNVTISNNQAAVGGGGIFNTSASSPTFTGGTISGNAASIGGGIYNDNLCSFVLTNTSLSGNSASGLGGGVYNLSNSLALTNVTLIGNKAGNLGGGIHNNSSPVFTNVTIAGNFSNGDGGGVFNSGSTAIPKFYNCILYGNSASVFNVSSMPEYYNSIIQGSKNNGNWVNSIGLDKGNNLDVDPRFVAAPDYSTAPFTTGDYQLKLASPAINAGSNSFFTGLSATTKDLAGNLRAYNFADGGIIDIGAYEYQGILVVPDANGIVYVKKGSSGDGRSWVNALGEVADALPSAAANTAIKQIWVAAGTYQTASSQSFALTEGLKMYGGFAGGETLLSARNWKNNAAVLQGNANRVIYNNGTVENPITLATVLDGFTISGGVLITGAGIHNNYASPTIANVIISGNRATQMGGGVYNANYSSPVLSNVLISGNMAINGGGMYNTSNSSPMLINVTISGNQATSVGGALYNNSTASYRIQNSILWGNTGGAGFPGIHERSTVPSTISYSLVQDVVSTSNGNISATGITTVQLFNGALAASLNTGGDYTLKSGSPAIAVGSNSLFDGLVASTKDLAGNLRAYNFATGGTIDLGAYEYQGLLSQTINFAALDPKTTVSADFTLGAVTTSTLAVSYTSSNTAIAEVYEDNGVWKVKIKGDGSVEITAKQAGNGNYAAATEVAQNLIVIDGGPLPVELLSYTAKIEGNYAKLEWKTTNERNNKGFVIYRSGADGLFVKIGEVFVTHNTQPANYNYTDKQPLNGNNYYKLVQVDNDGTETELGIKSLTYNLKLITYNVFPNPTRDKLTVTFEQAKYTNLALSSVDGKVLRTIPLNQQQDSLELDLSVYPAGVYFVRLMGAKENIVKKVIKQ